jgi:PelA/Pel-15E family pectate lyase
VIGSVFRHRSCHLAIAALGFSLLSFACIAGPLSWHANLLKKEPQWFVSGEARAAADRVMTYQSEFGAWPKNVNLLAEISPREMEDLQNSSNANPLDNNATTFPMQFLARVAHATGDARYATSFLRGLDYLLDAQYENGGWPQYFPHRKGYYSHITFNDNAMMNVMFLLRDVASGIEPYSFVDDERIAKSGAAVNRGIGCILNTQIRQNGNLTGWAAQYDEVTLEPAWARAYEPPSLSGNETVAVVRFLMEIEHPTDEDIAAIEGAVAWLEKVAVHGFSYQHFIDDSGREDSRIVAEPDAGRLWARFYEFISNRPLFLGRDSVFRYSLDEVEQERRGQYGYYGDWAEKLLSREYPRWRAKTGLKGRPGIQNRATGSTHGIRDIGDTELKYLVIKEYILD